LTVGSRSQVLGRGVTEQRLGGGDQGVKRDREVSLAIGGERGPSAAEGCGQLLGLLDGARLAI
jgi:hypothetical protein